jgi:hypothetical protein
MRLPWVPVTARDNKAKHIRDETYHQKLREYMEQESLTESAALVKIVKQFFDGSTGTKAPEVVKEKDDALAEFKADIAFKR